MNRSALVVVPLLAVHPLAMSQNPCSVANLDGYYDECRAKFDLDPQAMLACIQDFVAQCQHSDSISTESLTPIEGQPLARRVPEEIEERNPPRRKLLTSDDPNYFTFASPKSDDLGDVNHVEFYLSIKYPLYDQTIKQGDREKHLNAVFSDGDWSHVFKPDRWLFHYNGLYDFYTLDDGENGQYDSSPIISRRQNPGFSLEYDWGGFSDHWVTTRYGYFHESNGQQLDEEDQARFEFLERRDSEEYALSQVSRGWDYWQLRFDHSNYARNAVEGISDPFEQGAGLWHWSAELRWYRPDQVFGLGGSREDDIWWDETRNNAIEDFDGLRLMGEYSPTWLNWGEFGLTPRLEIKTSQEEPFKRISYRASTGVYLDKVNLALFYFDGYGRDPSTYHLRTRYWGLGLELR